MIVCIVVVAAFQSSTALTNAYGFSVATVMFSTTWLIAIQMYYVKAWPFVVGLIFLLVFGFFDGMLLLVRKIRETSFIMSQGSSGEQH